MSIRRLACLAALAALTLAAPSGAAADPSPGGRLAWSQFTLDFSAMNIVTARPDGSAARTLTNEPEGTLDFDPKWSPDGKRIVFERDLPDGSAQIVVMRGDGAGQRVVATACTDPCAGDISPSWTPGGHRIAFTRVIGPFDQPGDSARSAVLWTVRDDGSDLRRLSPPGIDGAYEDYQAH